DREVERAEAAELARYRTLPPLWASLFALFVAGSIFLAVNQLFNLAFFIDYVIIESRYLYLLVALLLPLVFLVFPAHKRAPMDRVPWYDAVLAALTFGAAMYFVWNAERILDEAWEYVAPTTAIYVSLLLWALVIEIGRRTGGVAI